MSKTQVRADLADAAVAAAKDPLGAWPSADALAALRAWDEGLSARDAVHRYLGLNKADGQSSRALLGATRRRLMAVAAQRHRPDLQAVFASTERGAARRAAGVLSLAEAIDVLAATPVPVPQLSDDVAAWFSARQVAALQQSGVRTLADLMLRVFRRRMWWIGIGGLGARGAVRITAFFAAHPALTRRAQSLLPATTIGAIQPWERLRPPAELDGSTGRFRAPAQSCALSARNDYEAIAAWLERQESPATQRAYRKEAERLLLWAIVERGKPMSSLSAEDATAYRAFLRRPVPHLRWVGPARPRTSPQWRPFVGGLSAASAAQALTVLNALCRWLGEQRYLTANPFAGLKVRGGAKDSALDPGRSFSEGEWGMLRIIADGLEWSYGWEKAAAHRLRFLLDFGYATGLRGGEFVSAKLSQLVIGETGERWLEVVGKGDSRGRVSLPPLATAALERYLVTRALPITPSRWDPSTPLLARVAADGEARISSARLWAVCKRFFYTAASILDETNPSLAAKLRRASPHWMRHTHASHALDRGAELITVRDNLRHRSLATTSIYLHGDEQKRARQLGEAFPIA